FEYLAGEDAAPAPVGLRNQEQERVRFPLQLQRAAARDVGQQLEPLVETEAVGPLSVGGAEVADEARDDALDARQRGKERPWVAPAEEGARVRYPEALAA